MESLCLFFCKWSSLAFEITFGFGHKLLSSSLKIARRKANVPQQPTLTTNLWELICIWNLIWVYKFRIWTFVYTKCTRNASSIQINHQLHATVSSVYYLTFISSEHVSGVLTPIIRSSTTAVAAPGFTFGVWW